MCLSWSGAWSESISSTVLIAWRTLRVLSCSNSSFFLFFYDVAGGHGKREFSDFYVFSFEIFGIQEIDEVCTFELQQLGVFAPPEDSDYDHPEPPWQGSCRQLFTCQLWISYVFRNKNPSKSMIRWERGNQCFLGQICIHAHWLDKNMGLNIKKHVI